ncbi:hypothetical protein KY284_035840 [Solanum tuberosum]|nr:hypothetical protein KY284_035840 [Solanum tuberosum]
MGDSDKGNRNNGKTLNFIPPMLKEGESDARWTVPLILRNWDVDFELDADMFSQIPIWVKFPRLPVGYWSAMTFRKVASAIGIPLLTDGFSSKVEKICYTRVLIEMDISNVLSNTIVVETPSGPWNQSIEYEWRPKFCNNCIKLGHMEDECWFKNAPDGKRDKTKSEGLDMNQGKGKRRGGKIRRMVTKWIPLQTQKNDANISDKATETPMVAQHSNEPDPGQRSGRQHVEDDITTEGIATTIETNPGQRSGKQHVVESICSENILAPIEIDPRQWSGKKHVEECSKSTLEDQLQN